MGTDLFSQPSFGNYIEILPKDQVISYVTPYTKFRYPKWMFWRKNKYYLAVVTKNKVYLVDPDVPSVEEIKENK